ncbi:spore germination protein [Paenibacillus algorifonticola]|uniref:Spore germination protein n=1 Tax=Paenibacillus algorifonticola TaxID=684063 RepID=A0A1I2FQM7_9BACL|nr:GerAB/ArcD/ProY family transporter [Paenibacillus algorifonticola]SFF07772.1 spore germination protein [Paenibacillus algorifonticola]
MKTNDRSKDSITATQAAMMTAKAMIGTGILVLPQSIAKSVETPDGWLSVLLSGILAMLCGFVVVKLSQRFPGRTYYQYSQEIVGKWIGACIGAGMCLYYIFSAGYLLRVMGEVVRMYLLDKTPIVIIMLTFMGVAIYMTTAGINAIAQLIELFLPIIILIMVVFIIFSFRDFELDNLRPVLGEGFAPVLKGIKPSILSFSGFEVMLFVTAFMSEPHKAIRAIFAGIGLTAVLYTLVVAVAIGSLTVEEVQTVTWPTMSVAMNIELPGGFFERFESLFTVLWVISMFTAFVLYHYGGSLGFGQLTGKKFQLFAYLSLPLIFMIAIWPSNLNKLFKLGDYIGYASFFMFGIIPVMFLILAAVRRAQHANKRAQ